MAVTDKELEAGVLTAAKIVEAHGDVYLTIFEKLSNELNRRESKRAKVATHLQRCRNKKRQSILHHQSLITTDLIGNAKINYYISANNCSEMGDGRVLCLQCKQSVQLEKQYGK